MGTEMELRQLRAFLLVAQKGGLGNAAHKLKLTPSGVSLRIKRLEREVGINLFERRPNKLMLTDDGKVFLTRVNRALGDLESAVSLIQDNKGVCAGNVSVALGSDLAVFFSPQIAAFVVNHPMVKLSLLAKSSPDTYELVLEDHVEIGIGRFTTVPPTLRKIRLFFSGLVAIYPKNHPLSVLKKLTLRHLASHSLILLPLRSATRHAINNVFLNKGAEMKTVIEVGGCSAIRQFVKLGLGVGLVHDVCISREKERDLHMCDVSNIFRKSEVSVVHRKSRHLTLAHKRLIEALSNARP